MTATVEPFATATATATAVLAPSGSHAGGRGRAGLPVLAGAAAMSLVGSSTSVSGVLAGAPVLTAQALRYTAAAATLLIVARLLGRRMPVPSARELLWLLGVTLSGTVVFNLALVHGASHAEPAVFAVAIACVPLVLVLGEFVLGRPGAGRTRQDGRRVLLAALVVSAGAALVAGFGHADATGLALAVLVLVCEAGFTLLAVPVLGRLGPGGVSLYTTVIAAVIFWIGGIAAEGPGATARLGLGSVLAVAYLAGGVTVVAFLCWYLCVGRIGAARAGLLTGVAPVVAALSGMVLGAPVPEPAVWIGIAVIAAGLSIGLRPSNPTSDQS